MNMKFSFRHVALALVMIYGGLVQAQDVQLGRSPKPASNDISVCRNVKVQLNYYGVKNLAVAERYSEVFTRRGVVVQAVHDASLEMKTGSVAPEHNNIVVMKSRAGETTSENCADIIAEQMAESGNGSLPVVFTRDETTGTMFGRVLVRIVR